MTDTLPSRTEYMRELEQKFGILFSAGQARKDFDTWKEDGRQGDLPVAFVFVDVDDFKRLNEAYTETLVDATLLPDIQRILQGLTRYRGYAYRQGGEEFLILLPNCGQAEARGFAERVKQTIADHAFMVNDKIERLTVSIGLAVFTEHGLGFDNVLLASNEAKKEAKRRGKNRVEEAVSKRRSALKLDERTYLRYRALSCPLLASRAVVTHLEQRYRCEALKIDSTRLPVTVLWRNIGVLIHPDAILGDLDRTPPHPFQSSPVLNELEYLEARDFIRRQYEAPPSKITYEGCDYRMTSIDLLRAVPTVRGAFGLYYDNILTQYAIEWELKKALLHEVTDPIANLSEPASLPLREAAENGRNPLIDGGGRCAAITISTLVVFRRSSGDLYTILERRSKSVGVSPGLHHVVPAGMFEAPNTDDTWSIEDNIWRELLEEVYDEEEQLGKGWAEIKDYVRSQAPINLLRDLINAGDAELSVTGVCCDLLNLRPEICTVLYLPSAVFAEARRMSLNWEYERQGPQGRFGVRWSRVGEVATELAATSSIVVSGAACLSLGREWLFSRHGV